MSDIALFNAIPAGKIEILYDEQDQPWFKRAHVGKFLDLSDIHKSLGKLNECEMCTRNDFDSTPRSTGGWSGPKDQQNRHDMFLSLTGVKKVIIGSRKPKAIELAKMLGIDILSTKILSKEAETLSCILKTFKGQEMKEQYTVDGYRIDLYFPTQKLAIECDEFGHKDRDISYEVTRQNHIETKLGCTFIRYNPDAKDFDIFDVLNSIINHIF